MIRKEASHERPSCRTAPVGGKLINATTLVCGVLIVLMLAILAAVSSSAWAR